MSSGDLRLVGILVAVAVGAVGCASSDAGDPLDDAVDPSSTEPDPTPEDEQPAVPLDSKLEIVSPERGAFIASTSGSTVEIAGKVTDALARPLTINGMAVSYAADGSFTTVITPEVGTNLIVAELGSGGASAQRSFVYGKFVSTTQTVPSAVALRVNASGFDDGYSDLDDLSTIAEEALAARNVMTLFPSSFTVSAPLVGTLRVSLPTRSAGRPNLRLSPRSGGVTGAVSLPSVYVKFDVAFNCVFTTCHVTGNVSATRADVSLPVSMSLASGTISASAGTVSLSLVGFDYDIDGSLGGLAESVINFFVPDVRQRLEGFLRSQIGSALPKDVGLTLSKLSVPTSITMPAPLSGRVNFSQRFDAATFSSTGATVAAGVRAYATFGSGDPGLAAPGWLSVGSPVGTYRTTPAFGVSIANDFLNQLLFAVWGQGSLDTEIPELAGTVTPAGTLGTVTTKALTPPIVVGSQGALKVAVGDFIVSSTLDGEPFEVAASLSSSLEVSLYTTSNTARLELVGTPTFVVEILKAPASLDKGAFNALLGSVGSVLIVEMLDAVRVPVPRIPLAGVAPAYATKTLKLSSPAEVVIGSPTGRTTLYGRLSGL